MAKVLKSEVARLVGIERREYEKDGEKRVAVDLHLCHVEGTVEDVEGSAVEVLGCPRGVEPKLLEVGKTYELIYAEARTKNAYDRWITEVRFSDMKEVDE